MSLRENLRVAVDKWLDEEVHGGYLNVSPDDSGYYVEGVVNENRAAGFLEANLVSVETVLAKADEHSRTHPTHGTNCACMDEHIRTVRKLIGNSMSYSPDDDYVMSRRRYVLNAAARAY